MAPNRSTPSNSCAPSPAPASRCPKPWCAFRRGGRKWRNRCRRCAFSPAPIRFSTARSCSRPAIPTSRRIGRCSTSSACVRWKQSVKGEKVAPLLYAALASELAEQGARGLSRQRRVLETPQGVRVRVDGRDYIAFCSNDYLGLAAHPELVEAACTGAKRWGVGAGASHLVLGHQSVHKELEDRLAAFTGQPRALLFSTGYQANMGVVTALVGRGDAVFGDRLNHASLNDAALLSRAAFRRYPHADLGALERLLATSRARRRLVVTDAVFSMDGDIAPVP